MDKYVVKLNKTPEISNKTMANSENNNPKESIHQKALKRKLDLLKNRKLQPQKTAKLDPPNNSVLTESTTQNIVENTEYQS